MNPTVSIVIAVYNDWAVLDGCLGSIANQQNAPSLEVIVVDDGSEQALPQSILDWRGKCRLIILQQAHSGIPSARNRGVEAATGSILVFVDADCRLNPHCLNNLMQTIAEHPERDSFQMRLTGDCSCVMGRAEELRLLALQEHLLQPDGSIRYLNTAGFAIRRAAVSAGRQLFDSRALRAEDTLLLLELMNSSALPLFAGEAVVQHIIPLNFLQCLRKDIRSARLEAPVFALATSRGISVRISHRERLLLLWAMWLLAGRQSIGRTAWVIVTMRQGLQRMISYAHPFFSGSY